MELCHSEEEQEEAHWLRAMCCLKGDPETKRNVREKPGNRNKVELSLHDESVLVHSL